jgi:mutator protein MutT
LTLEKKPPTHVVAAAVMDLSGRVLIAQRPAGKHLAGGWEFPGGKLMAGEDRRAGLARELREELGISLAAPPRPLIRVRHTYSSGEVLLDMWVVRHFAGTVVALDGQALRWCTQEELESVELLPADGPIVAALRLPERVTVAATRDYVIGDSAEPDAGGRLSGVFCEGLADAMAASDAGADFIVLRSELPHAELRSICEMIAVPVYTPGLELEEAWGLGATGVVEGNGQRLKHRID